MATRALFVGSVLGLLALGLPMGWSAEDETGFVSIFDGKTLDGWEGDLKTFRVDEGAIVAGTLGEKIPRNEFLCTKQQYGDFELRLQARLRGEGKNAGVQFRSQRVPNHHEVSGYQCDMGEMGAKPIWGWLYDESRRNKFLAEADAEKLSSKLKRDDWNDLTIRCEGKQIKIWVNGFQTVDYTEKEEEIAAKGIIGLQIHGGLPAEARYRKIRIKTLSQAN